EDELAGIRPWEPPTRKQPAWDRAHEAKRLAAEAARALARAEASFARALGRVADHHGARRGLARIHYRLFVAAERAGDDDNRTQHLDLARTYDVGDLALELSDQGELRVESHPSGAAVSIERYEPRGPLLSLRDRLELGPAPTTTTRLLSGSYLVT